MHVVNANITGIAMKVVSFKSKYRSVDDTVQAWIIETMGIDVLDKLSKVVGGESIRIPLHCHNLSDCHPIVVALGRQDAEKLVRQFGGDRAYIPILQEDRVKGYIEACDQGLDNTQIARKFNVTVRHARRMLASVGIKNPNYIRPKAVLCRHLSPEEIKRRDNICRLYVTGGIELKKDAAERMGISPTAFSLYLRTYCRKNNIKTHSGRRTKAVSVSNGGLTGVHGPLGGIPHPDNDNRAHGA